MPALSPALSIVRRLSALATLLLALVATSLVAAPSASAHQKWGNKVVSAAAAEAGDPWVYGAEGPNAFDCSGLTLYVFHQFGKELPRVSRDQMVSSKVRRIDKSRVKRGDLIGFYNNDRVYHIAIYAGDGEIWHSPRSGSVVHKAKIWTSSWFAARVRHHRSYR
jgi:cell wall-associated NlpC family hydrolase